MDRKRRLRPVVAALVSPPSDAVSPDEATDGRSRTSFRAACCASERAETSKSSGFFTFFREQKAAQRGRTRQKASPYLTPPSHSVLLVPRTSIRNKLLLFNNLQTPVLRSAVVMHGEPTTSVPPVGGPQPQEEDMTTRLLTLRDVMAMTALSRSAVYALMAESRFPKPIRVGTRAVRWVEQEVADFIASRPRAGSERPAA